MIRRHATAFRLALAGADAISAVGLFVLISVLRFADEWQGVWRSAGIDPFAAAAIYAAAWVTVLWALGLYRLRARWRLRTEILDVARAGVLLGLVTFSVLFVAKLPDVSRLFLLTLFVAQVILTIASRTWIRWLLRALRERGYNLRYMLIIGSGKEARRFADRVDRHRELGLRVIGFLAIGSAPTMIDHRPVLGTLDDIEDVLHDRIVDEVAVCLGGDELHRIESIARLCEEEGKIIRIPLDDFPVSLPGGRVEDFDRGKVLSLVYGPDRMAGLVVKRLLDLLLASVAMILLLPVFAVIAATIIALDGRPVLFRQVRVGLNGRPFDVVKFRTMVPGAEDRLAELQELNEISGHAFKLTNDPRLSRTGRWLRKTSVDELPQLLNVLRGEMSLVGPRPPLPGEVAGYDLWHRRRLSMKPGITGLWQVAARREDDFDKWVELDLAYIDRWSVWLDLKIMLRTIPAMLQGR
ncbi:MAG TPA: sugar transferase [Candidatus Saccharimonadales bacterium]|nr:sugar transferase [Candidatus Saccharimonadales bacterium]